MQRSTRKTGPFSDFCPSVTLCCLLFGAVSSSFAHMLRGAWPLGTDRLFPFTHHKPDLGIYFHGGGRTASKVLMVIKDEIWLNKTYGCNGSLPFGTRLSGPARSPLCSNCLSHSIGRESHSPTGPATPCPVLTSGMAFSTWNIACVYVCGFGAPLGTELHLQDYAHDLVIVDPCSSRENISVEWI